MPTNFLFNLFRTATLSMALIAAGTATALADPPGYYFQDEWQPKQQVQAAPVSREAAMQNSCRMADVGKPTAAIKLEGNGSDRAAANVRASLGAMQAR